MEEYFLVGYGEELKIEDIYFYAFSEYLDKPYFQFSQLKLIQYVRDIKMQLNLLYE